MLCLIFWKGVLFANDVNRERISALTSNIHRMVRFFFSFSLLWFNFWRVLPTRLFPTWTRLPSLEWLEVLIVFCWMHHALVWVWLFATPESRYCFCLCMSAFVYWPRFAQVSKTLSDIHLCRNLQKKLILHAIDSVNPGSKDPVIIYCEFLKYTCWFCF